MTWLFLGPFLLALTLISAAPTWAHPLLPLIALVSFTAIWCRCNQVWALIGSLFLLYFSSACIWGSGGWEIVVQELAFATGLYVVYLALEEEKADCDREQREHMEVVSQLKVSLHSLEEKHAAQERQFEKERQEITQQLEEAQAEIEAFSNLAKASQIEAKKSFDQSQALSAKSLQLYRDCVELTQKTKQQEKDLIEFQTNDDKRKAAAQARIRTLNWYRVELMQARLLIDDYIKRFCQLRAFFLKKKKAASSTDQKKPRVHQEKANLKELEEKKLKTKEAYQQLVADGKQLEEKLKRLQKKLDRASQADEINSIECDKQKWESELMQKKGALKQIKEDYVSVERSIFLARKELQQQGAFVG
ncbi:MAG: hypothetical protein AAF443_03595 [Chlamydiota bacterium]